MHKLVVLYSKPADPDHFRDYYVTNHLPLVMNMARPACVALQLRRGGDQGRSAVFRGLRSRLR